MLKGALLFISTCLATMLYFSGEEFWLALLNFLMSVLLFNKFKKNSVAIIPFFLLAFSTYSVLVGRVLFPFVAPNLELVIDHSLDSLGLYIVWLFLIPLAYAKAQEEVDNGYFGGPHQLVGLGLIFVGTLLCYFGLDTDLFYKSGRAGFSPYYEYAFVLFLLGSFFLSTSNPSLKALVSLVIIMLAFRDFYYGNRAPGLQFLFVIYVFFYRKYFTLPRFAVGAFVGFFLMGVVGSIRYVLKGNFSLTGLYGVLSEAFFIFDTGLFAFVSGQTMISTAQMISFDRVSAVIGLIANTLLGRGSALDAYQISGEFFSTIGGAWLPQMLYFYMGFPGVIAISIYLGYLLSLSRSNSRFKQLIYFYVIVSCPRWLLYSVTPLFRGMLITIVIYFIVNFGIKIIFNLRSR